MEKPRTWQEASSSRVSHSVLPASLRPHGPYPASSVHGILQARTLEWAAMPFSILAWRILWTGSLVGYGPQVFFFCGTDRAEHKDRVSFNKTQQRTPKIESPQDSGIKVSAYNAGDPGSIPGSGRSLEKEMASHSSILAGESHGQRSLAGYSP